MKIIYAKKSTGINEDGSFQNPKYFDHPDSTATSVVIYGDYPDIKDAYEKLGISVEVRKNQHMKVESLTMNVQVGVTPELQQFIDDAKAECKKVADENKDLSDQLKKSIDDLQAERVGFTAFKNDVVAMQARIDELKKIKEGITANLVEADQATTEPSLDMVVIKTNTDYADWTVPQIKDFLASKEIGFKSSASKDELLALIPRE